MSRTHTLRRTGVGLSLVMVGLLLPAQAASAAPLVEIVAPHSGPTAGGNPVRIYGDGFTGTTAVKFGNTDSTKFAVINDDLITAVVPGGGTDNTSVDVTVTGNGSSVLDDAYYYTNATVTVSPSTGLDPGDQVSVTISGYPPSTAFLVVELNPLQIYYEDPNFPDGQEPPYVDTLASSSTSSSGSKTLNVTLTNPFNPDGQSFDTRADCPVDQTTANFLGNSAPASANRPVYSGKCLIVVTQFGAGSVDTPISFSADPVPAPPVVTTNKASAIQGEKVTLSGVNWNANPFFGSSKAAKKPGETKVTVEICGIGGSATTCAAKKGSGTVAMTRYVNETLSGATLSGSITVDPNMANCPTCFIRVRQNRPAGGFIEDTVPLNVT